MVEPDADKNNAESPGTGDEQSVAEHQRLFSGVRVVSLLTLLSRITGLARDAGMAALFGNGPIMDAFSVAFRIPNLARRLFGEGALTAAFLPALVREMEQNGRPGAWRLASAMFSLLAMLLTVLVLSSELALGLLWLVFRDSPDASLLIGLTAVMLPYLLLICLAAQVGAVMHSLQHFVWPASISVLLNLVWIVGIGVAAVLWQSPHDQVYAISTVIVLGGVVQLLAPLPALHRMGFRFEADWWRADHPHRQQTLTTVRTIGNTLVPILLGLSVTQLNSVLDSVLAWGLARPEGVTSGWSPIASGTASALYLGQRMYQFPVGVLGVALGTVLFPLLSRHAERNRMDALRDDLSLGLRLMLYTGIPASVGLWLLAEPLTEVLFRHGRFDSQDVRQTAAMIQGYGCGVWAYCGLLILHRAFYAVDDQRTPLRVGVAAMFVNLASSMTLIWFIGGVGLAAGTAIASVFQIVVIFYRLQRRVGTINLTECLRTLQRTVLAAAGMGVVCVVVLYSIPQGSAFTVRVLRLAAPFSASLLAYWGLSRALQLAELDQLLGRRSGSGPNGPGRDRPPRGDT